MNTPNDPGYETQAISAWLQDDHRRFERRPRNLAADQTEDQGTGAVSGTDASALPDLGPLAAFDGWASVASTILYKAQTLAAWDPVGTSFDDQAWTLYLSKVGTIPFFLTMDSTSRDIQMSPGHLKVVADTVVEFTGGIATKGVCADVLTSVKKIATVVAQNKGAHDKTSWVSQGLISIFNSRLYVQYLYSTILMVYSAAKKGYNLSGTDVTIRRFVGTLDFDKCKRSSAALLGWTAEAAAQWSQQTSSADAKPNNSPAWGK